MCCRHVQYVCEIACIVVLLLLIHISFSASPLSLPPSLPPSLPSSLLSSPLSTVDLPGDFFRHCRGSKYLISQVHQRHLGLPIPNRYIHTALVCTGYHHHHLTSLTVSLDNIHILTAYPVLSLYVFVS